MIKVKVVDVQAQAVAVFGAEGAQEISGRPLRPEGDWRLDANTPTGGSITFHRGATADDVANYWKREGWSL